MLALRVVGTKGLSSLSLTQSPLTRLWSMAGRSYAAVSLAHRQREPPLSSHNLNPCIKEMEYAVRGAVPLEALKISDELKRVIMCYEKLN